MYRKRFGLHSPAAARRLRQDLLYGRRSLRPSVARRSLARRGPRTGHPHRRRGVGKTAALRHLCAGLPKPEHQIRYICDTHVTATAVYRNLAAELGLRPAHRRDTLWRDLKRTLLHLVDERGVIPILVIDEAQHLADAFFHDLGGFLNYAFDSRDLLTVWLVGLPALDRRLGLRHHAALATRIVSSNRIPPRSDRDDFFALVDHAMRAAGATTRILSDPALESLWRASRGVVRTGAILLRTSLAIAHDREREQSFVDDDVMTAAIDDLALTQPSAVAPPSVPATPPPKTRAQTGTRSRK